MYVCMCGGMCECVWVTGRVFVSLAKSAGPGRNSWLKDGHPE